MPVRAALGPEATARGYDLPGNTKQVLIEAVRLSSAPIQEWQRWLAVYDGPAANLPVTGSSSAGHPQGCAAGGNDAAALSDGQATSMADAPRRRSKRERDGGARLVYYFGESGRGLSRWPPPLTTEPSLTGPRPLPSASDATVRRDVAAAVNTDVAVTAAVNVAGNASPSVPQHAVMTAVERTAPSWEPDAAVPPPHDVAPSLAVRSGRITHIDEIASLGRGTHCAAASVRRACRSRRSLCMLMPTHVLYPNRR